MRTFVTDRRTDGRAWIHRTRGRVQKNYKVLRNKINEEKRQGKKDHNKSQFDKNKDNVKNIWKSIRSLVNIRSPKTSSIKLMDENNNLISDPTKIANIFNNHYSTIGSKVQQKIPNQRGDYRSYLSKLRPDGKPCINPEGSSFIWVPPFLQRLLKLLID